MSSEWVIALAAVGNLIVIAVLALVTHRYASETKRIAEATRDQAKATDRMAREMEVARYAAAKPIIKLDVRRFGSTPRPNLDSMLRNVGVGPAMSVEFESAGGPTTTIGVLGVGEETLTYYHVLVGIIDGQQVARIRYQDVFGNHWESRYIGKIVGDRFETFDVRVTEAGDVT
jgi:hypothetical protein